MNLTEIVDVVVSETSRLDKKDQIHRIVREAITKVHSLRTFPRDMVEDVVQLNDNNLVQFKFQLPPRFKSFEVVAPCTTSGMRTATIHKDNAYELVRPRAMLNDSYNTKQDIYYITGSAVAVRASVAPKALYVAYYASPEVADNYLETWLMELHPQTFIDTAKELFFKRNGREDVARSIASDLRTDYLQIMTDYSEGD